MVLHWLLPLAILLGGLPNVEPAIKLALVKRPADSLTTHSTATVSARETGLPFIRNYHPREFASLTSFVDNWCVLQDKRGVMVIGNSGGILLYNGISWQYVETPAKSIVRSLAMDTSGRIYVGASDDLGYLAPDKAGKTQFVSLLSHLPPQYRKFGDVFKAIVTPEGVYFLTDNYLFRWKDNRFQQWKALAPFSFVSFLSWANGKLYVQLAKSGLYTLEHEQLTLVSSQPPFDKANISVMLSFDKENLLIGTRSQGLFLFDGKQFFPYTNEANEFLITNNLYQGIRLPDGNLALATLRGGAVVMDQQGHIQRVLNKESGLASNSTYYLATDQQGGLWIASNVGVSRVEVLSPFSVFNERNGLTGSIRDIKRYQGKVYIGTSVGLFVLDNEQSLGNPPVFRPVPGFPDAVLGLFTFEDQLLIAGYKHLYQLRRDQITIVKPNFIATNFLRWRREPNVVLISAGGVHAIRWTGDSWKEEGKVPGIHEDIHTIVETPAGDLWLPTRWQGTLRVRLPETKPGMSISDYFTHAVIEHFGPAQKLPAGINRVYSVNDQILLRIGQDPFELYRFDESTQQFKPDSDLSHQWGLDSASVCPEVSSTSHQWWWAKYPADKLWHLTRVTPQAKRSYRVQHFNLSRIADYIGRVTYLEGDTIAWFAGNEGVVRYELNQPLRNTQGYQTLVDRIIINQDSIIYPHLALISSVLPFERNTLRFEFAAPSYDQDQENEFQYQLAGYEDGWSGWTKEYYKEYTRIPNGQYKFRLRARNVYGNLGQESTYAFTILPPWYKTWPMYGLYAVLFGGLIYGIVRWRSAQLRAEKRMLEQIVTERTYEIAEKNHQLEEQAGQLERQTQQLRELDQLKSNFFANISHEFRTLLTLILGTLNEKLVWFRQRQESKEVVIAKPEITVMHRNAHRLLQLINQLLDLSKIESGKLKLQLRNGDLKQLLLVIAASFSSLADFRRIRFLVNLPQESLCCRYDADQLEKICYNLLSNAFKFTPDEGEIKLEAQVLAGGNERFIQIAVQDSGAGIAAEQLSRVFDRFFQGSNHYQGDQHGTGIGLALTKELVQLHGGTIWAESEAGKGARFIVELPFIDPLAEENIPLSQEVSLPELTKTGLYAERVYPENGLFTEHAAPVGNGTTPGLETDESLPLLLIVEDNEDLRHYIRGHLQPRYRVLESENGGKGWETALATLPDLIISDWMMPDMDGLELCQRIKSDERTSHIPFILLTALATNEGKLTGLQTGADEYLTKPFDAQELHLRVKNLIESRRTLRERFGRELRIQPKDITVTSLDEKFMQRVMQIAEAHLGDSEFSAEQFGQEVGLSRMQLHRKLSALTGQSASDFIRTMRLKRAAQLLEGQAGTVSEIAYQVGFSSLSYFSKCFRDQFGMMASEYAERHSTSA